MSTWIEVSRSPEYSPAKIGNELKGLNYKIGIDRLDEALQDETIIMGGFLNTNLLAAKSIIADKLDVNSLSAISADIGEITSGTVTGAILRTSSTGDRLELSDSSFKGYLNSTKRVELDNNSLQFYTELGNYAGGIHAEDIREEAGTENEEIKLLISTDKTINLTSDANGRLDYSGTFSEFRVTSGDVYDPLSRPGITARVAKDCGGLTTADAEFGVNVNPEGRAIGYFKGNTSNPNDAHFSFNSKVTVGGNLENIGSATILGDVYTNKDTYLGQSGYFVKNNGSYYTLTNWNNQLGGLSRVWHIHIPDTSSPDIQLGWTNGSGDRRTVTTLANWSKRNIKENIREYDYDLAYDQIKDLPIYTYQLKNRGTEHQRKLGFMLDEAPFEVQDSLNNEPSVIDIYGVASLSIAGLKATQQRVEELKQKIIDLEIRISELGGVV